MDVRCCVFILYTCVSLTDRFETSQLIVTCDDTGFAEMTRKVIDSVMLLLPISSNKHRFLNIISYSGYLCIIVDICIFENKCTIGDVGSEVLVRL